MQAPFLNYSYTRVCVYAAMRVLCMRMAMQYAVRVYALSIIYYLVCRVMRVHVLAYAPQHSTGRSSLCAYTYERSCIRV